MKSEQMASAPTSSFSLRQLKEQNPLLAEWFMWRYDDWQGAGGDGDYVHLGCGDHVLEGFVNLDFVPYSSDVNACNLLDVWPERLAGKLQAFHAEDVMEHFFLPEQLYILASINYLMRQGGLVRILMPDINQLWTYAETFDAERMVGSGDYFADVMRCRSGMDAVNTGMRMGGHRWLHSFDSFRRVAGVCGFSAEFTSCASSSDPKLCGLNLRDESGISFASELRKGASLRRLLVEPLDIVGAELVEDLGNGQKLYRSTTDDPAVHYAFDPVAVDDIAVLCIRNANVSEFREHNFAKAYFRLEESGAIYVDRTLQSVPHANIFSQVDIAVAMKGEPTLKAVRFDPSERAGDFFTTGPLELFYFESRAEKREDSSGGPARKAPAPDLPKKLADHVITTKARPGRVAHFDFDGPIGLALDIYGEWAQHEVEALLPFIPQGGHVVDVGANLGSHTLAFARAVGEQGTVLSVEPQEETFALLRHNVAINDLQDFVRPLRAAAGKERAALRIPRISRPAGQNLGAVAPVAAGDSPAADESFAEVEVIPLDELELPALDFLKIDAEGAEADVLRGAAKPLAAFRPVVAMECGTFSESWEALGVAFSMGYAAYHFRSAAYNADNYRGNKNDIFAGAEEGTLLLLPQDSLEALPAPPARAERINGPLDLIRAILSTGVYGRSENRLEPLHGMLADFRRKRAEERCVTANALATRRHKAVMELRETVSVISRAEDDIDPEMLHRVLESTAPVLPDPFEPEAKAPWPTVPDPDQWDIPVKTEGGSAAPVVDVIIPCYNDYPVTMACLHSALTAKNDTPCEFVVIDDLSPEPRLSSALRLLSERGLVTLLAHAENKGFVISANEGMSLHADRHALLLNADTIVFDGWLDRLMGHLEADPDCGTVTPLSNNATICSYPVTERDNQAPLEISFAELDALAAEVNSGGGVSIPTGVGFCMLIRRACLDQVGLFDAALFGKGYGEENDFCMRAAPLGWKHLLATDVFVRHAGEKSFGEDALRYKESAFEKVSRLHEGYLPAVARHCATDPARRMRRRLDIARLRAALTGGGAPVLLVGHNRGGGIERYFGEQAAYYASLGAPVLTLRPHSRKSVCEVALNVPETLHLPNLVFDLSTEFGELLEVLGVDLGIGYIHVHSLVDLHPQTPKLLALGAGLIKVKYDFTVHDYLPVCPKVNMLDERSLPCAGTEEWRCQTCLDKEALTSGRIDIAQWRGAYRTFLAGADRVVAPSEDAARRIAEQFPECAANVEVAPHPETITPAAPVQVRAREEGEPLRVAVIGAIGPHKGSGILEACASDAKHRGLPVEFVVVGYSDRDERLKDLGVTVTGRYEEEDVFALLDGLGCHLAFFPSPWPETYCYSLSVAALAGLPPVVFDHGAPAERVAAWEFGFRLPLALMENAAAINDQLLSVSLQPHPADLSDRVIGAGGKTFERLRDNLTL